MQEISLTSIGQTVGGVVARANQKVAFIVNSGRNGAWRRARTVGCQTKFTPILAYVTEVIKGNSHSKSTAPTTSAFK